MKHYNLKTMAPVNAAFLLLTPIVAIISTSFWIMHEGFDYRQLVLALGFFLLTGLSITAGYHRLFSHSTYPFKSAP